MVAASAEGDAARPIEVTSEEVSLKATTEIDSDSVAHANVARLSMIIFSDVGFVGEVQSHYQTLPALMQRISLLRGSVQMVVRARRRGQ